MDIYFSDYFLITPEQLEKYGAFNISLINDLPLFIDPFLLFNSHKAEYQELHNQILRYMRFLRDKSADPYLPKELMHSWYVFPEVRQTWLGFSKVGNFGQGLRGDFAKSLHKNLSTVFSNFGEERITHSSHLEKLCLIKDGIGRDRISDFTTNLTKEYLLDFTQKFAKRYIRSDYLEQVAVRKVRFNYTTETWEGGTYTLPWFVDDFVLLTPKDILTKDDIWINRQDLFSKIEDIQSSVPDPQLRAQLNNYLIKALPSDQKLTSEERTKAVDAFITEFPEVLDYYIRYKEDNGDEASSVSKQKVALAEEQYVKRIKEFAELLRNESGFYNRGTTTYQDSLARVNFLKDVIENKDGYRIFYHDGMPITRENDVQILYRLTWYATESDVNREVNNGRGPVDFKVSRGSKDSTIVEFKLAKNTQLKRNLINQVPIYEKASDSQRSIVAIIYFSQTELFKVRRILKEIALSEAPNIVLIDACRDNKPSASKA